MVAKRCLLGCFTAVSTQDNFWDFVPCSSGSNRLFGEHVASLFRVSYDDRIPLLCYRRITVNKPFLSSMGKLINSDSTVTHRWNCLTLGNPEDGTDIFSEILARTGAKRYKVPDDVNNLLITPL
jgi:hypothetical protein